MPNNAIETPNFKEKIIIALDYDNTDSVKKLLRTLGEEAYFYKIGFELFTACGIKAVETVKNKGHKVFLDLKFNDIPNTVYKAVKAGAMLGADIINVHASGGEEMMKAAKRAGEEVSKITGREIDVIAVTILTSLGDEDLFRLFYSVYTRKLYTPSTDFLETISRKIESEREISVENVVFHLARLAEESGLDGVVCSGHEIKGVKIRTKEKFKTIVPGIRLHSGDKDQKRVMTPSEAFRLGADYIVIGREITAADDPLKALKNIHENIYANINP